MLSCPCLLFDQVLELEFEGVCDFALRFEFLFVELLEFGERWKGVGDDVT